MGVVTTAICECYQCYLKEQNIAYLTNYGYIYILKHSQIQLVPFVRAAINSCTIISLSYVSLLKSWWKTSCYKVVTLATYP